jgi:hypothetical protein
MLGVCRAQATVVCFEVRPQAEAVSDVGGVQSKIRQEFAQVTGFQTTQTTHTGSPFPRHHS